MAHHNDDDTPPSSPGAENEDVLMDEEEEQQGEEMAEGSEADLSVSPDKVEIVIVVCRFESLVRVLRRNRHI